MDIDLVIVLVFFAIIFLIGVIDRKKVGLEDYWVNGRKTNKWILVMTMLSTFIGAAGILGNAGVAFSGAGFATLALAGSFLLYFLIFALFFAPKIKEFGDKNKAYTIPDYLGARFGERVRVLSAIVNLVTYSVFLALQILGMGVFVSVVSGFDPTIAVVIGGLIVIAYTTIGGLRADIRTDVFQFIVMALLLVVFLPMLISKAGGFGAIGSLPSDFLNGSQFAPVYVFIAGFIFLGASVLTSADVWQRAYAADTKRNARFSMTLAGVLVLIFLVMAMLFGIFGKILVPNVDPNFVVPETLKLVAQPGLLGILLAGFFAAIMSSADTMLLVTSMTVTHDLYQRTRKKKLNDVQLMRMNRWVTLIVGIIALSFALIVFNIVHLAIESASFYVALFPAIVFGFYWKDAKPAAALWSILLGFATVIAFLFVDPIQAFIPGLVVSFITFFVVQWLSKK